MKSKKRLYDEEGLLVSEVGAWSEEKIDLVKYYATLFTSSMKGKWDRRVYIDLFAGPGRSKIKGKDKLIDGTAMHMLGLKDPFDIYVFCDLDPEHLNALQSRIEKRFPQVVILGCQSHHFVILGFGNLGAFFFVGFIVEDV
jgi:three-Cys-motif partner protein